MLPKNTSDKELIKQFLEQKDSNAFSLLYDRYANKVYRRCLQFFQNQEKAKEATQEIFIKIAYRLHAIREKEYFSTWLYTVTYRYCIDNFRKQKNNFFLDNTENKNVYYEDNEDLFDDFYADILEKGLQKLDTEERTILLMKYMDNMNVNDIASALNIKVSAVKMRLKRSRDKLISICNFLINKSN